MPVRAPLTLRDSLARSMPCFLTGYSACHTSGWAAGLDRELTVRDSDSQTDGLEVVDAEAT